MIIWGYNICSARGYISNRNVERITRVACRLESMCDRNHVVVLIVLPPLLLLCFVLMSVFVLVRCYGFVVVDGLGRFVFEQFLFRISVVFLVSDNAIAIISS